jgi:stage II sporulation protein D
MKKMTLMQIIVLFAMTFFCSNAFASLPDIPKNIEIGIILDAQSFTTGSSKDFYVYDLTNKRYVFTRGIINIACSPKGVKVGKYNLSFPVRIEPSNGVIFANSKPYRGYLLLKKSGSKINVINVLYIEEYIRGVLPKEVGADWHIEVLKSQAVISRTYAIANLNRHRQQGFDMCSTTHCQVYGGAGVETNKTNLIVSETSGEVLTFKDGLAQTVFHATCGGRTDDPKYIWGWKDTPIYLRGVKCGYCNNSPHAKWEQILDGSFIRNKLRSYNINIGEIKKIKIKGKTHSGAAKEVVIVHSGGEYVMNAYKFRTSIDAWKIKSHLFDSIKFKDGKFCFKGKGWGHKAGLCQCGAKGMAERGKKYSKILRHFYPKTKIQIVMYK